MNGIPRPEHPRPQFERAAWLNLNGEWSFTFDFGKSGMDRSRELFRSHGFDNRIRVPFCPESALSDVRYTDFIEAMWYHRQLQVPTSWAGKRILLHFGAVDYESEVFIDGQSVGTHFGGATSFEWDITRFVKIGGENHLVVRVADELRPVGRQPSGKQSSEFKSAVCHYTRTTGIWQTVWLEAVEPRGLRAMQIIPDFDGGRFSLVPTFFADEQGLRLTVKTATGETISAPAVSGVPVSLPLKELRPWSPASPFLYELDFVVSDASGRELDRVRSYAGLRKIHIEGNRVFLNNAPLYQRLVLDQGFYPEGIWTAPSDAALKHDIELAQQAGFNGARLHQKVFEERFHYWADRLGYLTWGESPSWGCDPNSIEGARNFLSEWAEIIHRDRNHPSLITWTPWNETNHRHIPQQHARVHRDAYRLCKAIDPTRPVNDASGYVHVETDLWTVHHYEQDPAKLQTCLAPAPQVFRNFPEQEVDYAGQPYLVDEFGGIKWIPEDRRAFADNSWGYGNAPKTLDEFYQRLTGQVRAIISLPHIVGFCYTQLTDVEQEQNGIYNYDRTAKFDMPRIAAIFKQSLPH